MLQGTSALVIGAIYFTFQIYADFSGYSDIAIGVSRLLGFSSMQNFRTPYFSRDIAEFWRRWHISLTSWFRDYLYIPLGGNRGTKYKVIRNTFIVFLVCGFWHGANWTFIAWGKIFAQSLFSIPYGTNAGVILPLLLLMLVPEWLQRNKQHGLEDLQMYPMLRWAIYISICLLCIMYFKQDQQFIYFQF